MYYVYQLIDPRNNEPFYIGKGKGDRWKAHLQETYETAQNRRKWCKIESIRQDGYEPSVEFIKENIEDENEAYNLETTLIMKYGRKDYDENGILTNICKDNRPPSAKGRIWSDEYRKKISERQIGPLNHRFGTHWSEEEKEKRSNFNKENNIRPPARTGILHTEETKNKISSAMSGKAKTKEHIEKISKSMKGKHLGKIRTEEQKKNISEGLKSIYKIENSEGKVYEVSTSELKEFCEAFTLVYSLLLKTRSNEKRYKGWKVLEKYKKE